MLSPTDIQTGSPTGRGAPAVVCVHGVGVDARSYAAVVACLHACGHEASAPERPTGRPVDQQLAAVLGPGHRDHGPEMDPPVVWAGVSGGATLATLALTTHRDLLAGAVLHEPLVGSLTPGPRRLLADRARVMVGEDPATAASRFVRELVGDATWFDLGEPERRRVATTGDEILADAATFLALEPELELLATISVPVVVTVGERSSAVRHDAAERVAATLGWSLQVVPGAGHLAQVDAPDAFAAVVDSLFAGFRSTPTRDTTR